MRTLLLFSSLLMASVGACSMPQPNAAASKSIKVVYHLSEDESQAYRALNNIANHLRADPEVKVIVVAHGKALEFLKRGMISSDSKSAFADAVVPLQKRGVEFRVCRNSMNALRLDAGDMIDKVAIVPSGIAEVVSLQARDGYAYVRP
jgi:uncharacterized protein